MYVKGAHVLWLRLRGNEVDWATRRCLSVLAIVNPDENVTRFFLESYSVGLMALQQKPFYVLIGTPMKELMLVTVRLLEVVYSSGCALRIERVLTAFTEANHLWLGLMSSTTTLQVIPYENVLETHGTLHTEPLTQITMLNSLRTVRCDCFHRGNWGVFIFGGNQLVAPAHRPLRAGSPASNERY